MVPGAPPTIFNDWGGLGVGGIQHRFIFYTQKITTSEYVYPKEPLPFLAYPKQSLSLFSQPIKIPLFFSRPPPKKIPVPFIYPGQNFRRKKNHLDSLVIEIREWGSLRNGDLFQRSWFRIPPDRRRCFLLPLGLASFSSGVSNDWGDGC